MNITQSAFPDLVTLESDIRAIESESGGGVSLAARELCSRETFRYHADRKCKTASVIKLPILVHTAIAVRDGTAGWDDTVTLTDECKAGGSGVLPKMTVGLKITLRDLCMLMTIISDNTATNMVIDHVGREAINTSMRKLGLPITNVNKKAYAPPTEESREFGFGVTTPDEMIDLLTMIAEGKVGDEATSRTVLEFLDAQQGRNTIPRFLEKGWKYAGKGGAIDNVRKDVGLVTSPDGRRYALAIFSHDLPNARWTVDHPGMLACARAARRILLGRG